MKPRHRTQEELNAMFRRMNAGKKSSDLMAVKGTKTAESIARDYRRELEKKGVGNLQAEINKLDMKKISPRVSYKRDPDYRRAEIDSVNMTNRNAPKPSRKAKFFLTGFEAGEMAATVNCNMGDEYGELKKMMDEDRLGEAAGDIRSNQRQFAGDISYDVGRGVTEKQFEDYEEGFTEGFVKKAERLLGKEEP